MILYQKLLSCKYMSLLSCEKPTQNYNFFRISPNFIIVLFFSQYLFEASGRLPDASHRDRFPTKWPSFPRKEKRMAYFARFL